MHSSAHKLQVVKAKLSLCVIKNYAMKKNVEVDVESHVLTSGSSLRLLLSFKCSHLYGKTSKNFNLIITQFNHNFICIIMVADIQIKFTITGFLRVGWLHYFRIWPVVGCCGEFDYLNGNWLLKRDSGPGSQKDFRQMCSYFLCK